MLYPLSYEGKDAAERLIHAGQRLLSQSMRPLHPVADPG